MREKKNGINLISNNLNIYIKQKKTKMRKVIAIFAIATTLVACGGNVSTETVNTDSTVATVDTTAAPVVDSAVTVDSVK